MSMCRASESMWRAERELEEAAARAAARDRARGGVCMPHVLLAAAIAQSQPQQSFPAALAPRPPVRPILGHDLQRLAARMSLDETIVPWAAEQEVEEWEPAAGYEESTFPSLGLLECGECDCDADAPPRHVRSSGGNVFYLCDCAGGSGSHRRSSRVSERVRCGGVPFAEATRAQRAEANFELWPVGCLLSVSASGWGRRECCSRSLALWYCCSAGLTLATVVGEPHCCSVVTVNTSNTVQLLTLHTPSDVWTLARDARKLAFYPCA